MDWIDVALIVLGLAGCGVLHLMAVVLVGRRGSVTERLHLRQAQTGSIQEVER